MKWPRISVGAVMVALVVVAIDCVVVRSIQARQGGFTNDLKLIVLATLPMANLLAVGLASLAGGKARARSRPRLVGSVIGAGLALLATAFGLWPAIHQLESALQGTDLAKWIESSPGHEAVALVAIVGGLPLLFQGLMALAGGLIGGTIGSRSNHEPMVVAPSPGRPRFRSLAVLLVLVAVPALAVEEYLRWKVDPSVARFAVGSEAVFFLDQMRGIVVIPKASTLRQIVGARVRIEQDREPNVPEMVAMPQGTIEWDRRMVQVTVLDGPPGGRGAQFAPLLPPGDPVNPSSRQGRRPRSAMSASRCSGLRDKNRLLLDLRLQGRAKAIWGEQVHRPAEEFFEVELEPHEMAERGLALEGDEDIHVAPLAVIATGHRAEESQRLDRVFVTERGGFVLETIENGLAVHSVGSRSRRDSRSFRSWHPRF